MSDSGNWQDRLDRPPADCQYLRLPESFGRRFTVFVDTEEEFDWSAPFRRDHSSTSAISGLPQLQARFTAAGVKPVYMIDYPIVINEHSSFILKDFLGSGQCSLGAHLHPWVNPPFHERVNARNSFPGNLPQTVEREKIARLTEAIHDTFGVQPIVYRAGRYGVGPNTANILREFGYRADVSARARFDYRSDGGPDFRHIRPQPYALTGLVEIPLTATFTGQLRKIGPHLLRPPFTGALAKGVLARGGLLSRVALTPEDMPLDAVLNAADLLLEEGQELFSIAFHSPSATPGHTPYVRDAADLAKFYAWWDGLFEHFAKRGVAPASLDEAVTAVEGAAALAKGEAPPLSAPDR